MYINYAVMNYMYTPYRCVFLCFPKLGQTIYHDYMKLYIFPASIYIFSVYKFIVQTNTNSYFSKCIQIMSSIIFYSNTGT